MAVSEIDRDIGAFEKAQADLEAHHNRKWVLFHNGKLIGAFDSFDRAAEEAVRQFGRGPYLIRQVGAPPIVLSASVMYAPRATD